jgi:lipopolysaccharide/colanic/teichoic acid biosynthesis glycosyltransferase
MDARNISIFFSLFPSRSNNPDKKEPQRLFRVGGVCSEPPQSDSAAPGFVSLPLGGGRQVVDPFWRGLSPWSCSTAKRVFDCACALLALPIMLPLLLVIAAAVGLTSRGSILFLQKRAVMNGHNFTIFKFRTMEHAPHDTRPAVTTFDNQKFTPIGSFLRRWKLDELPQLANVLLGQMSMVGPRPKMPDHLLGVLPCRPGVTSGATLAFAQEAAILTPVPGERLNEYYRDVILPAKRQMDAEYLAQATFFSDLGLLINSVLRRWNTSAAKNFITAAEFQAAGHYLQLREPELLPACLQRMPISQVAS